MLEKTRYLHGFGNHFLSEALKGVLPEGQNSPQKPPHGLYAEQLSGTAFTAPRTENQRSWLYRIRPSVCHKTFKRIEKGLIETAHLSNGIASPNQMRWSPLEYPKKPTDFLTGLITFAVNGRAHEQTGCAVHLYAANSTMENRFFYNADGDFLIVPQEGGLIIHTEFGNLEVEPAEIALIPRGIKFQVNPKTKQARGYVCENYGRFFRLPDLGPIGANGLANPRDFLAPTAAYIDKKGNFELITKFQGALWAAALDHHPLNAVGWHGNYVPLKYDLRKFQVINTVSFDHCDPSIFTVLTSPSCQQGTANVDFVIFPPRWMVAEHTFRPPYFHRNYMNEYMGLVYGEYDAKAEGFLPGGGSLHNCMSAHGPDSATFEKASSGELKPQYIDNTLAFMFESRYPFCVTEFAFSGGLLQQNYNECWQGLGSQFKN